MSTVDISKLEKARLYINIEGDKLMEYYKVAQNGSVHLNAEKWTRIGLETQPGAKVSAKFQHQEETHDIGKFNKYDPKFIGNSEFVGFRQTATELVGDMHHPNENFYQVHLTIDGKNFIASQKPVNSIEHYTSVTTDQIKDLIKEALLNRVLVKTTEDGTREQRSFVSELNFNFGRSHYSTPEQIVQQHQETIALYAKNGVEIIPVNSK